MPRLTKDQKKEEVAKLAGELAQAKAVIFALYRGLTVKEVDGLRRKLRGEGISFKVVKTSLLKRALEQEKLPVPSEEILSQPIAVAISHDDEVTPAKLLYEVVKSSEKLQMLAGLVNADLVDQAFLTTLAQLPGRDELLGRLVGTLSNLPRRLVWSMKYPTYALTNVMRAYQSKVGG